MTIDDSTDETKGTDLEDEYEILAEVGRGGSAVVYRARDRVLGREVAIKVVRARHPGSEDEDLARLAREARMVAQLQHVNIVTVHAVKRLRDGGLALVMQLVPGRTLKEAIVEDGPFAPDRAERVLRDVAQALAHANAHGVVHRDVKPENIFLDAVSDRALLSDFGIAHSSEFDSRLTMTGAAIGTPAYMAPEQIDGAPADARSDVYSLGLVAWEMLTGHRPWAGETLYNVIFKQKHDELPTIDEFRSDVPLRLQYVVERMLLKQPKARWAGADGLLAHLDAGVLPADWTQWQNAHARRLDRRGGVFGGAAAFVSAALATIRFRRSEQANDTERAAEPIVEKPLTPRSAPRVTSRDALPVTLNTARPVTPKSSPPVTPKSSSLVTPKNAPAVATTYAPVVAPTSAPVAAPKSTPGVALTSEPPPAPAQPPILARSPTPLRPLNNAPQLAAVSVPSSVDNVDVLNVVEAQPTKEIELPMHRRSTWGALIVALLVVVWTGAVGVYAVRDPAADKPASAPTGSTSVSAPTEPVVQQQAVDSVQTPAVSPPAGSPPAKARETQRVVAGVESPPPRAAITPAPPPPVERPRVDSVPFIVLYRGRVPATRVTAPKAAASGQTHPLLVLPGPSTLATVATITVSPTVDTLVMGQSNQLSPVTRDAAGALLAGRTVMWSSSNDSVATVSPNGTVTAIASGYAIVSAVSDGQLATASIIVLPRPVGTVTVTPSSASILTNRRVQLKATARDADGKLLVGPAVSWSSANTRTASVSGTGSVVGHRAGTVRITATVGGVRGSTTVIVRRPTRRF